MESHPSGIECGAVCIKSFSKNAKVTLTASPEFGSTFEGWVGGGCSGTSVCTVTMDIVKSVSSIFNGAGEISVIKVPVDQPTIQEAITSAVNGDIVLVASGRYQENLDFSGKALMVTSQDGPEVTIIDANLSGEVVRFISGEGQSSVLSGFTLQKGQSGIRIRNSSPIIFGNMITNNKGSDGLGISSDFGSPIIQGNSITKNTRGPGSGGIGGGGISIAGTSNAQILDNIISDNVVGDGGGIRLFTSGPTIIRGNIISGNIANGLGGSQGGGILVVHSSPAVIVQNIIIGNSAREGGGIALGGPPDSLMNNTIANNDGFQGSGIFAFGIFDGTIIVNNIITALEEQTAIFCRDVGIQDPLDFSSNNVFSVSGSPYGGVCTNQTGINGNISSDPSFASPAVGAYYLNDGSASIDAGDDRVSNLPPVDFIGNSRTIDGDGDGIPVVDIGAIEFAK